MPRTKIKGNAEAEAALIRRLHILPPEALFTTIEAGLYLGFDAQLLRTWRWRGEGPEYIGSGRLTRYRKAALDRWQADWAVAA